MHYKVITREKVWELATDITTNRWQEIVMTWHNYKGITLFVNGAFKDSAENGKNTGILREDATPRLLVSRRATDLKPFAYTKYVDKIGLAFLEFFWVFRYLKASSLCSTLRLDLLDA